MAYEGTDFKDCGLVLTSTGDNRLMPRQIKIVMLGKTGVGKTSLLKRYKNDQFTSVQSSTSGIDFFGDSFEHNNQKIHLNFWDTAGQERFRSLSLNYFRGSQIVLLTVSAQCAAAECITQIEKMLDFYYQVGTSKFILVFVNKMDLVDGQQVKKDWRNSQRELAQLKSVFHIKDFVFLSAKQTRQETLRQLIHEACLNLPPDENEEPDPDLPLTQNTVSEITDPDPSPKRQKIKIDRPKKKQSCCK